MSYVGSTPTTQSFIAGTDQFTGTGSQTNWTLSRFVNSTNDIEVVIANVVQNPTSYSVSGNTLTISPAVSNGVAFYVRYLSTTLQSIAPGQGTVGTAQIQDSSVTTAKIADANVTTAKIADANVTTAKIADSSVTTAKIAVGAVITADLADGAVTSAKLATGAAASNLGGYVSSFNGSTGAVSYTAPVTSVNGQTGAVTVSSTPTTADVLNATAGASFAAVGTYVFAVFVTNNTTTVSGGSTTAGNNLEQANAGVQSPGTRLSGTWRAMGYCFGTTNSQYRVTLWLRIA